MQARGICSCEKGGKEKRNTQTATQEKKINTRNYYVCSLLDCKMLSLACLPFFFKVFKNTSKQASIHLDIFQSPKPIPFLQR
jgi:hypothetical protein